MGEEARRDGGDGRAGVPQAVLLERAEHRANHARRISGRKDIRYAEAFQREIPIVVARYDRLRSVCAARRGHGSRGRRAYRNRRPCADADRAGLACCRPGTDRAERDRRQLDGARRDRACESRRRARAHDVEPAPVALVGELLATQAQVRGVAGLLVDGAVRDLDELRELGLPIWTRFVRAQGATKGEVGKLDVTVTVGRVEIHPGDLVVIDCDGAFALPAEAAESVLPLALERAERERVMRGRYEAGELSYDLNGLREIVEG